MSIRLNASLFVTLVRIIVFPAVCVLTLWANTLMWVLECAILEMGGPTALEDMPRVQARGGVVAVMSDSRGRSPALNMQLIGRLDRLVHSGLKLVDYRILAEVYAKNGGFQGIVSDSQILEVTASFVVAMIAWYFFDTYTSTNIMSFMSVSLIALFPKSYNALVVSLVLRYFAGAMCDLQTLSSHMLVMLGCRWFSRSIRRDRKRDSLRDSLQVCLLVQMENEQSMQEQERRIQEQERRIQEQEQLIQEQERRLHLAYVRQMLIR